MPTALEPCVLPDPTTNPPEQYLEWRTPCSALALSSAAPAGGLTEDEVAQILGRSITTWRQVQCEGAPLGVEIGILEPVSTCEAPLYRDGGGNVNTLMFVEDWIEREYDPSAFAVTTVWHRRSTGEILDVDMEVNELRGPYGVCPPEGCVDNRLVDLENVLTHELGHYLGLAHSADPEATMFASAAAGETTKRDLAGDDIEGICAIYPRGTPSGDCNHAPRGGLRLDCRPDSCSVAHVGGRGAGVLAFGALPLLLLVRRRTRRR